MPHVIDLPKYLAERAGPSVPRAQLVSVADRDVLVVERFDRRDEIRIGYVSAMTMLEATDGDQRSYLDIAEVIERWSAQTTRDLHELWSRMVFSVLITNTDDHLRNHGFLHVGKGGWSLAPAFDLNPVPDSPGRLLSTSIDFDDPSATIANVLAVAPYFRLSEVEAERRVRHVAAATADWRDVAEELGVDEAELAVMEPAFEHAERAVVGTLRAS